MSTSIKLAAMLLAFGLAACGQQEEPAPPAPAPVIVPEPVFTGKG